MSGDGIEGGVSQGPRLPMIYLNEAPCKFRRAADPFYRCLVLKTCTIGAFDVRKTLSIGFDGIFSVQHTVVENEPTGIDSDTPTVKNLLLPLASTKGIVDAPELDFHCSFVEFGGPRNQQRAIENFTFAQQSHVRIISKRPISSTAQVIKPTTILTAIVSTAITVEAVLDQPGLRIVQGNCAINDEPVVAAFDLGRGLYTLEYEVREGDTDRPLGKLPFQCEFQDAAGNNITVGPMDLQSWFSINANPPRFKHVRIKSRNSGTVHAGDQVVVELLTVRQGLRLMMEKCALNGIDVMKSQNITENGAITVSLNVTTGQSDWFAGQFDIDCWVKDKDGNAAHITTFTDNNTLAGDAHTPGFHDYLPNIVLATGFAVVSVASGQIATLFPNVGFPLITGYLLTGILAGPEILNLIPEKSIRTLRFVDEISLAVIAISAGAKIYLPKMKGRWKSIGYVLGFLLVIEYVVGAGTIFVLHPYINFMKDMTANQIAAVALMAGTLVCARSPASAVAIVREMKAEGPWTQTVLGVTVLSDVSVIALFALTSLFTGSLLANRQHSNSVVLIFGAQMMLSSLFGWVFGIVLVTVLSVPLDQCGQCGKPSFRRASNTGGTTALKQHQEKLLGTGTAGTAGTAASTTTISRFGTILKCTSVISLGFLMFVMGHMFDPYMEPLITCMVGGFIVANYSNQRKELHRVLDQMSNGVMIAFFTLAGAALNLESLSQTIMISTALFLGRIGAIIIGSWLGGWMAGDPSKYNRSYSLGFVTQAGVTLGLAKKIHLENRVWGGGFATVIIACVVMNQLVGPVLLRWAISYNNEAGKQRAESVVFEFEGHADNSKGQEEKDTLLNIQKH
jgi:NhaP-type Na+/H+ or K+/H+ antiporter